MSFKTAAFSVPTISSTSTSGVAHTCFETKWHLDWTLASNNELKKPLGFPTDAREVAIGKKLTRAAYHFIHDALAVLTVEDIAALDWHQLKFLNWMQLQDRLAADGKLGRNSASWAGSSDGIKQQLFDEVQSDSVNGRLLCRVGFSLVDILRKKAAPLELMMGGNLLYSFYETALRCHRSYEQVKQLVTHFVHKTPRGRILEIGGGTGGCTGSVLAALSGRIDDNEFHFSRYDFTDVSSGFFEQAKTKFETWAHLMKFQKLDIEADPAAQGFDLHSYDLVIACQVLHATKDMKTTMANVRSLMKPSAKLIMVETTKDTADVQLIFGTLPGWWLGDGRVESPNMPVDAWQNILSETGFSGVDIEVGDCDDRNEYSFSTMMTTAIPEPPQYPQSLTIVPADHTPPSWTQKLKSLLETETNATVVVNPLGALGAQDRHCIFLLEVGRPFLSTLQESEFTQLQTSLTNVLGALWVTSGDLITGSNPDFALHSGLLRTLRMENANKRLVACDVEAHDPWSDANLVALGNVFKASFKLDDSVGEIDCEFAVKDAQVHIARIYEDMASNNAAMALAKATTTQLGEFVGSEIPLRINIGFPGLLDSLRFVEDKSMYEPLPDDYIEIEPKAFGLNFRDVLLALGHIDGTILGYECSGVVTKVGSCTQDSGLKVGDRVCAVMQGHYGTPVRLHWTWAGRIPATTSFEEAATIPMVFITAYQSLFECARLEEGETILIHAATGGVGQAAIMLAQYKKAKIFVTVGTEAKRQFIIDTYGLPAQHIFSSRDDTFASGVMAQTNGLGVDVILNSLAGNLLKASWDCISSFGRFIEIGKRDIEQNKALSMTPFRRAASFAAIDLDHMTRLRGHVVAKAMRAVMDLWADRHIQAVTPVTQFPMSNITGAFRLMQSGKHLGKIVIIPQAGDKVPVLPSVKHFDFSPNASYLIAGGLGGIGRGLSRYLASIGCKNIIMMSRSAEMHSEAAALVKNLASRGCNATITSCDVSDVAALRSTLQKLYASGVPPVRGVIQGAMALHDSIFEHMTHAQWQAALRPKHAATWNLHTTLPDLDFFVMLSSLTGVGGSTSQANYSAGSTFQDAFAKFRVGQGLPAVSIDLGSIKGVGYVAENEGVVERLIKIGFEPIEEVQTMRIIETAMINSRRPLNASQMITGICKWDETMTVAWKHDRRFWPLQTNAVQGAQAGVGRTNQQTQLNLRDSISSAQTWDEAVQCCIDALMHKVMDMFALPLEEVDASRPLAAYGVDSLVAVEVRNWLAVAAKADVSIFDIMQSSSLEGLAERVTEKSLLVSEKSLKKDGADS